MAKKPLDLRIHKSNLRNASVLWWHELVSIFDEDGMDDIYQDLHYYLESDTAHIYVARTPDGKVLAMAVVLGSKIPEDSFVYGDERFTGSVCLEEIYTLEEYRGKGVGSALLDEILADHANISLTVRETNPAVNLYLEKGFSIADRVQSFYPKADRNIGSEAALTMYRNTNIG